MALTMRRSLLVAAAAASVLLLSACAPGTSPVEDFAGLPVVDSHGGGGEGGDLDGEPRAMWLEQGGKIAVTTWGSSTCPLVGNDIRVLEKRGEGNAVEIVVPPLAEDRVCTMDFVPHTTVFWTPMDVTTTEPLRVVVLDAEVIVPVK